MMQHWKIMRVMMLALVLGLGSVACGSGGVTGHNNDDREEPTVEVPAGSRLLHVNTGGPSACDPNQPICAKNASFNTRTELKVQLVNSTGAPVSNTVINFDPRVETATGTTLSALSSVTDESGFAAVDLMAGTTAGTASIIVSAGGNEADVEEIRFVVAINDKGASSYIITFEHAGTAELKNIQVRAFKSTDNCAAIAEDHVRETTPGVNPILPAEMQVSGIALADGTLPQVVIPNVPNGTSYNFEARAYNRNNEHVESAWGCKDSNPPIENGQSQSVVVRLVDNLPRLAGSYDITHVFSIQDAICAKDAAGNYAGALPSGVCTAIDLIGRLATDPGSFLVGDQNNDGLLQLIVDFLPDGSFKDSINSFLGNNFIQDLAGNIINDFALDWINQNAPAWVRNAINITGDIYASLQQFRVNGTIRILQEPVPQYDQASNTVIGILEADAQGNKPGRQVWNEIVVYWTGDCPPNDDACRMRTFSANDVGTDNVVEGTFDGTLLPVAGTGPNDRGGYGLQINEHTLTLNYGVFLLGIVEKIVLPSVFGDQSVTSLEAALDKLITGVFGGANGCDGFGDWVTDKVGGGGAIAESLCNNLLSQASDRVRDFMTTNLTVAGDDNFLIGSPTGEPCRLHEPAAYPAEWEVKPLPYIAAFGENRPGSECNWSLKIKYGSDVNSMIDTRGTFYGPRAGF